MIDLDDISFVGSRLSRPECVLCHRSGIVLAADWTGNGGVAIIRPNGSVRRVQARATHRPMRPNGIALEDGGSVLMADLGAELGGVFRLLPDGMTEPVLIEVDGHKLPPTNFVHLDAEGRIWITVSTSRKPRDLGYRRDVDDGFVILLDAKGPRVVAEGLGYTNECVVGPNGDALYVNETFARRLSKFPLLSGGRLGEPQTVAEFGSGTYPDGLCFDAEGAIWVTSIVSNRVIRITPDGGQVVMIEDVDPAHIEWTERAFQEGRLGREHLDKAAGRRLRNISSLAFGGEKLTETYLGCLLGSEIAVFESPVSGHPPVHWDVRLGGLGG